MAKKKTNGSSLSNPQIPLPKLRPIVYFEASDIKAMMPHLVATGAVICASFVLAVILLLSNPSLVPPQTASINKTFGQDLTFVRAFSQLLPNTFALHAENAEFPFQDYIASLQGHTVLSAASLAPYSLIPQPTSIAVLTNKQFGTTNPWSAISDNEVVTFAFAPQEALKTLSTDIALQLNKAAQDAVLELQDGKAVQFQPDMSGSSVDVQKTWRAIQRAFAKSQASSTAEIFEYRPNRSLSETNTLGIIKLVTSGESNFAGSTASRIHNIRVGSSRFNGVIIKPGEEFSFNHFLGDVTAEAGFKPELVIKSSGTVPELGGGLCQVSTTAFRAALFGGLPITERRNHSYAVKYYAPQGTDATIYPGVVDLKFVNDTAGHLLVWTRMEGTKLYFDFYGTPDNRDVVIDGPRSYDFGAGGAMKASLTRIVMKDGEEHKDEFFSRYVSQDLFPRVYEFVTPVPPPQTDQPPTPPANTDNPDSNEGQPTNEPQNPDNSVKPDEKDNATGTT